VQNFLKENADKVKALVGDNAAVAAAVSAITDIEPENVVNGFLQSVGDAAEAAKDSVVGAVEDAKDAAKDKANEVKDAAKDKANDAIDAAADKAKSLIK
jgi:creatinine amidohydrolase/Fe(II)-dependent formamide hydrolase-like protein